MFNSSGLIDIMSMQVQFKLICIAKAQNRHIKCLGAAHLGVIFVIGCFPDAILVYYMVYNCSWKRLWHDTTDQAIEDTAEN